MSSHTGRKVSGVPWEDGVIANCQWGGVRVRDLLVHAGVHSDRIPDAHVQFASYATLCEDDAYYGSSVPLAKALSVEDEVLLAWEVRKHHIMISSPMTI